MNTPTQPSKYVVELHHPGKNRRIHFPPLDRKLRGRLQLSNIADSDVAAKLMRSNMPQTIPGIHIELTKDKAVLRDPMMSDLNIRAWAEEQCRKRGEKLPPETEEFENVQTHEWLWWMRRLCDAGKATPVGSELPELADIKYQPPANPLAPKPKRGKDRLKEIFQQNPQTAADYLAMPEEQQRQWRDLVGV